MKTSEFKRDQTPVLNGDSLMPALKQTEAVYRAAFRQGYEAAMTENKDVGTAYQNGRRDAFRECMELLDEKLPVRQAD